MIVDIKKEEVADILMKIKAVNVNPGKGFKGPSGLISPVYIDNRLIISYPEDLKKIIYYFKEIIYQEIGLDNIDVIAGTAVGGVPYAAILAHELGLPLIFTRNEYKKHGKKREVEGNIKPGDRVLLVEDHIITGTSSISSIDAIREKGGIVQYCLSISNDCLSVCQELFREKGINAYSLISLRTLVDKAIETGYFDKDIRGLVQDWIVNPLYCSKKIEKMSSRIQDAKADVEKPESSMSFKTEYYSSNFFWA